MARRGRIVLAVVALVVALAGAWATRVPPRVTLLNSAVSIDHPWPAAVGWLAIAAAPILLGVAAAPRVLRVLLILAGLLVLVQAWHVAVYRLEAGPAVLDEKQALARLSIPWTQVTRVESGLTQISVFGPSSQILIDTSRFSPEQRATLDRTIARRLREH
jgi:hypothetical protein